MIEIDFKGFITDTFFKENGVIRSYVRDHLFFGYQLDGDLAIHQRITCPEIRKRPCISLANARKIIMNKCAEDPDNY